MRPTWFHKLVVLTVLVAVGAVVAAPATGARAAALGRPSRSTAVDAPAPVLHGIDLEQATIPDLQQAFASHRLSSVVLTAFYLRRIQALEPRLHALTASNPKALLEAAASDVHRGRYGARSPLEGIPVLLKDNIDTARQPATAGSLALVGAPAPDAFLVRRLRAAGAVLIGKANLSEWANFRSIASSSGWSAVGGQNNNPYVLDRNPCGSSSGSGTAAAANLAVVAIGTETDGSIVCPSGAQGVVGIKPTLGLVSRSGVVPISAEQDTAGPIARHVIDATLTLSVLRGVDPDDPATASSAPFLGVNLAAGLRADALRGKRIGVWTQGTGAENVTEVGRIGADAAATLREAGATVVTADLPNLDQIGSPEFAALLVEFKHDLNVYLAARPGQHPRTLAELIAFNTAHASTELQFFGQELFEAAEATNGDLTDPTYLAQRRTATTLAQRAIDDTLTALDLDAIVAPTNGPAWKTRLPGGDDFSEFVGSSTPAAVAGYPTVTVPAGFVGPLPIGISLIGSRYGEAGLLALGYAYEQASQARRPPTFIPSIGLSAVARTGLEQGAAPAHGRWWRVLGS
jgi:amidase